MTLNQLLNQYDPAFDLIPNAPQVTWADKTIADELVRLQQTTEALLERIARLEETVAAMDAALCGYNPDDRFTLTEKGYALLEAVS